MIALSAIVRRPRSARARERSRSRLRLCASAAAFAATTLALPALASADNAYWSASAGSALRYGSLAGGAAASLLGGEQTPAEVAINPAGGTIYWADTAAGTIRVASLSGGAAQTLYTEPAGAEPVGIAINAAAGRLYWTDAGTGKVQEGSTAGGGTSTTLFTEPAGAKPTGLAVNSGSTGTLYWTDSGSGAIRVGALKAGAVASTLYEQAGAEPSGLAVDGPAGTLLWTDAASNAIESAPLAGGGTVSTLYSEPAGAKPRGLALDTASSSVYWANSGSGELRVSSISGGGVQQTLFSGEAEPVFPAVLAAPVGTGIPKIAGHYEAGNTLTCGTGHWAGNMPGANYYAAPQSYAYQWSREGVAIEGASAATYAPPSEGSYTCTSTASNAGGASSQTSVQITVKALPPSASIASPVSGSVYEQYALVPTSFACAEGAGGPGLASCKDSNGAEAPGGQLTTSYLGTRTYSVIAISKNGKRSKASITYTIVPRKQTVTPPEPKSEPKPQPKPSTIAIRIGKARVKHARTLILLACKGGTRCRGVLSLAARVCVMRKGHMRWHTMLVARKDYSLKAGESRDVALRISGHAEQLLTRSRHRRLKVSARVTLGGGHTKHRGVVLHLRR